MSVRKRVSNWRWVSRLIHWLQGGQEVQALREFVYLDEVSVYSLLASQVGAHTDQITESFTKSQRDHLTTGAEVQTDLIKLSTGATREQTVTQGSQVLRKATVQASFKALRELTEPRTALRTIPADTVPPKFSTMSGLAAANTQTREGWAVEAARLERGRLLELEVELAPESIFHAASVFNTLLDMADEAPQLAQELQGAGLGEATSYLRLIERLLAGLIPLRGRATAYSIVETPRGAWIVHHRVIQTLQLAADERVIPLDIVGVAEQSHFWRDIRRVLFSNSRYQVMCRVAHPGLVASWTPVKAMEAFNGIAPDLVASLNAASEVAIGGMKPDGNSNRTEAASQKLVNSLRQYATAVADEQGRILSPAEVADLVPETGPEPDDIHALRELFRAVDTKLADAHGVSVSPEAAMLLRTSALISAGLLPGGPASGSVQTVQPVAGDSALVDCEFVAIYW